MMNEKYNDLCADELFENIMMEVECAAQAFTKTSGYKKLNYKEQQSAVEIINYFGEYMFDYHLESMCLWSEKALEDVLISVFPNKISAHISFFKKIESVLVKFFEFLYQSNQQKNALELVDSLRKINDQMLNEVTINFKDSLEGSLFDLGTNLGLDMSDLSDIDRLYKLVALFEIRHNRKEI